MIRTQLKSRIYIPYVYSPSQRPHIDSIIRTKLIAEYTPVMCTQHLKDLSMILDNHINHTLIWSDRCKFWIITMTSH